MTAACPTDRRAHLALTPPFSSEPVITTRELGRRYGKRVALRHLDLDVRRGELFGFLGPNGAGKSTTINILATLLRPTSGTAVVAGFDVMENPGGVRSRIGMVFQDPSLDGQLTARQNLNLHCLAYDVPRLERRTRVEEMLDLVGLRSEANTPVRTFSTGMKRRLEIARGLLHRPRVLFLDEPTIGLDPQIRQQIWRFLRDACAEWRATMFVTTHYMEEAEGCDRVAIINDGELVASGSPDRLKGEIGGDVVLLSSEDDAGLVRDLRWRFGLSPTRDENGVRVEVRDGASFIPALLLRTSAGVRAVTVRRPSLEDVFLSLTQHPVPAPARPD